MLIMTSEYFKLDLDSASYDTDLELCRAQHLDALPDNLMGFDADKTERFTWVKVSGNRVKLDSLLNELSTIDHANRNLYGLKVFPELERNNSRTRNGRS